MQRLAFGLVVILEAHEAQTDLLGIYLRISQFDVLTIFATLVQVVLTQRNHDGSERPQRQHSHHLGLHNMMVHYTVLRYHMVHGNQHVGRGLVEDNLSDEVRLDA